MGRLFLISLEGKFYSCKHCRVHLARCDDIISKSFHCRHGKAYLFEKVVNETIGEKEERMMMTGLHTVADIFCVGCGSIVGWKYESASEKSQKYKEGKYILERCWALMEVTMSYPMMVGSWEVTQKMLDQLSTVIIDRPSWQHKS